MKTYIPRTYMAKPGEVERKWYVVDAEGKTLGRLAAQIAHILRGKHKPTYTPHIDVGDFVIVINAEKVRVTGTKAVDKVYYRHSGYPGGLKATTFRDLIAKHPTWPIELAVRRMLPKGPLGRRQFKKLKVYAGPNHPHAAQKPEVLQIDA
ncbi:50S ribosomal protein L13 [Thermorudis peleae]|uniref:50S ribosomal protein L13 n=1 Tax=Thermorudis peleae TaxID=1382356 RepID=UPI000570EE79|nr:50S ribosomal protein L13 [Thermorudis peleae]